MKEGGREEATHSVGLTHIHTSTPLHTSLTSFGLCHTETHLSVPLICVALLKQVGVGGLGVTGGSLHTHLHTHTHTEQKEWLMGLQIS